MLRIGIAIPTAQEGVEPATADAQYSAKHLHRIGLLLLGNELISQLDSRAKKAVAS